MEEFEKSGLSGKYAAARGQSPVQDVLSRSVSPAPRPISVLRLPLVTQRDLGSGSNTDRGPPPTWSVPSSRQELLDRYYTRVCETQPSPPRTRFLSYRLDAAGLLVSRLSKHLGKILHHWKTITKKSRGKHHRKGLHSSLSMQLISSSESWSSNTPTISLLSRRAWQQQRASERVFSALFALISTRMKTFWEILIPLLIRDSAAYRLSLVLFQSWKKRVGVFFTHELFTIPKYEYQFFRQMIRGVNRLISTLTKIMTKSAFSGLKKPNLTEKINFAIEILEKIMRKRKKEDFNRLRFFSEILAILRKKRQKIENLQILFNIFAKKIEVFYDNGFKEISKVAKNRTLFMTKNKPFIRNIAKNLHKSSLFRLKSAIFVWKFRCFSTEKTENLTLFTILEKIILRMQAKFALNRIKSVEIFPKNRLKSLFLLHKFRFNRLIFAWSRLKSSFLPAFQAFPFHFLLRILRRWEKKTLKRAFGSVRSHRKLTNSSKIALFRAYIKGNVDGRWRCGPLHAFHLHRHSNPPILPGELRVCCSATVHSESADPLLRHSLAGKWTFAVFVRN